MIERDLQYESFCRDCGMVTNHVAGHCTRCHPTPVTPTKEKVVPVPSSSRSCAIKRRGA